MKIGIISDIHGNAKALAEVLKELKNRNINKIICLGDLIGGAPMSEQVVNAIQDIKDNAIIVRGNREEYIINGIPEIVHDEKIKMSQEQLKNIEWVKDELSTQSIKFIKKLPKEKMLKIEEKSIYISHYPMQEDGTFRKHIKEASVEENEIMFLGIDADIYLYGHTHKEVYNYKNGKMYINPGALGCPNDTNKAPYGILEINEGEIKYEQLYVEYDVQEVIRKINELKFPAYEGVLRLFYGK